MKISMTNYNIFQKNMKSPLENVLKRQLAKKRPNVSNSKLSNFFGVKDPFKKDVV
jgi:hypothetical protein